MKKYFLYFTAVVTLISMIFTTSCQRVENPSAIGVESEVSFSVSTPDIQTRAYSDGTTANKLTVAVYNGESLLFTEVADMQGTHANVTLTLVNGMNYNIVFWAQAAGAPYHFDTDKRTMTVDYNGVHANDENLDAFWKKIEYKSEGAKTQKVELTRPFAQLNIAASKSDWEDATKSGVVITESSVKIENVYRQMDMLTGEVTDEVVDGVAVEFRMNDTPDKLNEKLSRYEDYHWLAMNYLLVNEQELVVVTFNTNSDNVSEKVYRDIPVKRNYRTNIYGKILTSDTEFNVETKPGFDGDEDIQHIATGIYLNENGEYVITEAAGLEWLANMVNYGAEVKSGDDNSMSGKTFVLASDIDLKGAEWEPIGCNGTAFKGTFDGNGKTISNFNVNRASAAGLFAKAQGTIKNLIIDNANIKSNHWGGAIVGYGLCSRIEKCTVKNSSIVLAAEQLADGKWDNGDKAGGIVGYLSAEPVGYVKDCYVENVIVQGYRDLGGLVGYAGAGKESTAEVSGNKVKNITLAIDNAHNYKNYTSEGDYDADYLIGEGAKVTGTNHSPEGQNVTTTINSTDFSGFYKDAEGNYVATNDAGIEALMDLNEEDINVKLNSNVSLDVTAWADNAVGGESTKTIVIDLQGNTLTFNQKNSDWNNIAAQEGVKMTIKNGHITNSGYNNGPWNRHNLNFACDITLENITTDKAIALKNGGTLKNVTINDKNDSDTYALWIQPKGQTITLEDCVIDMLECTDGRGIKIDNQYLSPDEEKPVTLNISNTVLRTEEKSAVIVKTTCGAVINWGEGNDISEVAEDDFYAVWVDEDSKNYSDLVNVSGCCKKVEGEEFGVNEKGHKVFTSPDELVEVLTVAGSAGAGNTTIAFTKDMDMSDVEWTPIYVHGYEGADIVTIEGNGKTITNLSAPLFAGGFAGGSGIVIKNLTIANSNIVSSNTTGSGAFIESSDSQTKITLENCHLKNSTVKGSRTGGLVGWTSGYSNENDGPVKSYITFDNCSVIDCNIEGSSVGGINGHAGASDWTYTTIKDCTVKNCKLNSTDTGDWRVGVAVGTANIGEVTITNLTESGNVLTQTGKTAPEGEKRNYYGRFSPGTTGILVIDGNAIVAGNAGLAAAIGKGAKKINLLKGEYIIPDAAKGKTLTFVGLEDNPDAVKVGVTKVGTGGENCDYGLDGSTVTFENITITTNSSTYIGYARCNGTYKNCVINGTYTLYGESNFENCTFNVSGDVYNIWTWGAPAATFKECTFNSDGKAMLLYGTADTKLTVNNCTFNDNGGLTDKKAAIETGNDYNKSYELIVNNTTVNGYEINDKGISTGTTLWANKNSMGKDKLNVVVDGIDVY